MMTRPLSRFILLVSIGDMACLRSLLLPLFSSSGRSFHTSAPLDQLQMMSRCRVVDNSAIGKQAMLQGKPPKVIHAFRKMRGRKFGLIGDKIRVAIMGQTKLAVIIGCRQRQESFVPRFDSNNIVLLEPNGNPTGTRVLAPMPNVLRANPQYAKVIALATKFV